MLSNVLPPWITPKLPKELLSTDTFEVARDSYESRIQSNASDFDATLTAAELSKNKSRKTKQLRFTLRPQPYELKWSQARFTKDSGEIDHALFENQDWGRFKPYSLSAAEINRRLTPVNSSTARFAATLLQMRLNARLKA